MTGAPYVRAELLETVLLAENTFLTRFWGVRGSIACPGPDYSRFGGNTSCIEVMCGERRLILDGGTGLRQLGSALDKDGPYSADFLFTHSHIDHVSGFPFFSSAFNEKNSFRIWSGHLTMGGMKDVLCQMMSPPLFPVPIDVFQANLEFHEANPGTELDFGDGITVKTAALNHPDGATGYRIEYQGKSLCYVTDTEHVPGKPDENILGLIKDADVVIYDCSYQDEEFENYVGWGHSTWQEGVRLCDKAGVKTFVVFHHDPSRTDRDMDQIEKNVVAARPGSVVAREGLTLHL